MPTAKQRLAVQKLVENSSTGKSKKDALLAAGYSEATAIKPSQVTESEGYKEAAKPFVKQMEAERNRLIKEMSIRKLEDVEYKDMTTAIDKLTKNIQLLTGGETERVGESIKVEMI